MKRFLGMFLSLVIVLGIITSLPITVGAASVDDLTFVLNNDGDSYSVADCNDEANGNLIIPSEYKTLTPTPCKSFLSNFAIISCLLIAFHLCPML